MSEIKSCVVYKFFEDSNVEDLLSGLTEEALLAKTFTPCGDYDQRKVGFTPFLDGSYILETATSKAVQITAQKKVPHGAEVKRRCKKKEAEYIVENDIEDGVVSKDVKELIKSAIIESMLPETPAGNEDTTVVWFTDDMVMVGCPNYNKAEDMISMLRMVTESLPVEPIEVVKDVSEVLTEMVATGYEKTGGLCLWDRVEMVTKEGAAVILAKGSIYDATTKPYLDEGAVVVKIQMEMGRGGGGCYGAVIFNLNEKLEMSGIKVHKDILGGYKDEASLIVTMPEIERTFKELINIMS